MGLLKFKKRKESFPSFADLDIPPEPPKMLRQTFEEQPTIPELPKDDFELPELPPLDDNMLSDLPPPPQIKKEKKGFFSFLKTKKAPADLELPELPALEKIPSIKMEEPEEAPEPAEVEEQETQTPAPAQQANVTLKRFIKLEDFRNIQDEIANAKAILRGSDELFTKLEELGALEDKSFSDLSGNLRDVHNKIMFADKSLFKEV